MGVNSTNKGHDFERKVAKIFSEWWGSEIRRTPMSGGSGISNLHADLVADEKFPFSVECKKYREVKFSSFLTTENNLLIQWWEQSLKESFENRKVAIVVFAENRGEIFVMVAKTWLWDLKRDISELKKYIILDSFGEHIPLVLMTLKKFLSVIKKEWFYENDL